MVWRQIRTSLGHLQPYSVAEIETSTDLLSDPSKSVKVVRVRERFVVKVGTFIPPLEAENMKFVAAISNVRYLGNLNRTPYYEGILSTVDHDPNISSPFDNEEQLNQGLLKCLEKRESPHYVRLLREPIQRTPREHKTVFTHADLQPKNVMVEQKGVCEDGSPDYQITLVDWGLAGWYPEHWDYCNSSVYYQSRPDWLELLPDIFDEYPVEYLMMRILYTSIFY
ncbi:hypothetical protein BDW67DRAFT_189733 [Aspergillus spinulosporus]